MVESSILIVDDNEGIRELLKAHIDMYTTGTVCHLAFDGAHAWKFCQNQRYNLIITDKVMPGLDGWQLIHKIRGADSINRQTPIILISSFLERQDQEFAKACGNCRLMGKPIDSSKLQSWVEEAV